MTDVLIHPDVQRGIDAMELPEVQEMLERLAKYGLAIAVPHMHGEEGEFLPLPKGKVSLEAGLEVSFKDADGPDAQSGIPVMWRCDWDNERQIVASGKCKVSICGFPARPYHHESK